MTNKKKKILLDLDGVLNTYAGDFKPSYIPTLKEGAAKFLEEISNNFEIKLFTARDKNLVSSWVMENNLQNYISEITNIKEPAWLIVDDRCIRFEGKYDKLLNDIYNFNVWYKS